MAINIPQDLFRYWQGLREVADYVWDQFTEGKRGVFNNIKYLGQEMVLELRIPGMKKNMIVSMYDEREAEEIYEELQKRAQAPSSGEDTGKGPRPQMTLSCLFSLKSNFNFIVILIV